MRQMPLAIRIPLVVILFMAVVAGFVSERVLTRLQQSQARHLDDLATVYLDGLSSALVDPVIREDVWEIFDIVDRARQTHAGLKPAATVVANAQGLVLASSDPRAYPSGSALPESFLSETAVEPTVASREDDALAVARRDVPWGGRTVGSVHATFDIAPLVAERRSVLVTLITTNTALTLILAVTAWFTVRRMIRPVGVLAAHLESASDGTVESIPPEVLKRAPPEFGRLFSAFNTMADASRERESLARHLAEEERLASLGRLASGMAHEINNPLGGLFAAIDTLRTHGERSDVRRRTIDLIERGLKGIRDVVRATLVTYRADRATGPLRRVEIDDLKLLVDPAARGAAVHLDWDNDGYDEVAVPSAAVRQVLLNLLLNACKATPAGGRVALSTKVEAALFVAEVTDSGPGLSEGALNVLSGGSEQMVTEHGTGLGLWMVRRLMKEVGGTVSADAVAPHGTRFRIAIPIEQGDLADVA